MNRESDTTRARLALARLDLAAVAEAAAALPRHPRHDRLRARLLDLLASIVEARADARELAEQTNRKERAA